MQVNLELAANATPVAFIDCSARPPRRIDLGGRSSGDPGGAVQTLFSRVEDEIVAEPSRPHRLPGSVPGLGECLYAVPACIGAKLVGALVVRLGSVLSEEQSADLVASVDRAIPLLFEVSAERRVEVFRDATDAAGDITRAVARSAQLPSVLPVIASGTARSLGFERATVLLLEGSAIGEVASHHVGGQPDVRMWGSFRAMDRLPAALLGVLDGGAPVVFAHPGDEPGLEPRTWVRPFSIATIAAAPIVHDGEPIGLIVADDRRTRTVGGDELEALHILAAAAGDAIAILRLIQDERAALHRSQLVLGTVVQAATQLNTSGVLTVISEGINKVLGDETTVAFVLEEGSASRLVVCGVGDGVLELADRTIAMSESLQFGVGSDFVVMAEATHPGILEGTPAGRAVALPLRRAARDLGWVISFSGDDTPYDDQDLKIVSGIAAQAALSLHTALLLEQERATIGRLEELSELQAQFVASVSHELRTPLTALIGYSDIMAEIIDDPTLGTYIEDMRRESAALEALIGDLLDTSRLEGGNLRLNISYDDPIRAVREAIGLVEHSHPGRMIRLAVNGDVGQIPVDHSRLRQVVTNLVDNAVKYSPEHEPVAIEVARVESPLRGPQVEIVISDRGPGIPVAQREAAFQRFNRLQTKTHSGTGIGLYLVRALVEAHGGTVKVADGTDGIGSRFVVQLPVSA